MANNINALLFLLVVLLLSLYDITGQGLNDVSIDEMTTPVEVTPDELKSHLKENLDRVNSDSGVKKASANLNIYLALESKSYDDNKVPGEIILKDGEEVAKYAANKKKNNNNQDVKRLVIPKSEGVEKIYVRSTDKKVLQNLGLFKASCLEKKVCRAYVAGMGPPKEAKGMKGTWELAMHISYMCKKSGTSRISFEIEKRVTLGLDKTTLAFTWDKVCGNGPAYGFNIYLRDKIGENKGEVMKDGTVSPEFNKYNKMKQYQVGYSDSSTWFLINGPSGKDGVADDFSLEFNISAVKIKPMGRSNKKLEDSLAVMLGGEASNGGKLSVGDSVPLILRYDCLASGTNLVSVQFKIKKSKAYSTPSIVSFDFKKICHIGPLPGFDIAVSGIDLGADFFAVKDGVAVQAFKPDDHTARVTPKESALNLEIMMARPLIEVSFGRPIVTVKQSKAQMMPPYGRPGSSSNNPFQRVVDKMIGPHSIFGGRGSIFDRLASPFKRAGISRPAKSSSGLPGIGDIFRDILGGSNRNDRLKAAVEKDFVPPPPPPELANDDNLGDDDGWGNDDDVGGGGYDDVGGGGVRRRLRRLDNSRRKLWRPKRYDDTTTKIDPRNRILEVSATGDAALGGTVMSNQSLMLTVLHDCIRSGTAQVYVKIPLRRPKTSMSIAKTKDDDTKAFLKRVMDKLKELKTLSFVEFSYVKECKQGPVPGFDVSFGQVMTTGVREFFPVKSGVVTASHRTSRSEMRVREGEETSRVYFSEKFPDTRLTVTVPILRSHNPQYDKDKSPILIPRLKIMGAVGSLAEDQLVTKGKPFHIFGPRGDIRRTSRARRWSHPKIVEIEYNCQRSGLARMSMSFSVTSERYNRKKKKYASKHGLTRQVTFGWVKECHLPSIKGLMVVSSGTKKNGKKTENVMVHGVATAEYHPKTACTILNVRQNKRFFYISSTANMTMPFLQPIVTTNNDGVDVNVKVNDMGSLMTDHFVVSRNTRPAELKVGFECKKTGSTLVTITLPLRPNQQDASDDAPIDGPVDLSFSFAKKCRNAEDEAKKSSRKLFFFFIIAIGFVGCLVLLFTVCFQRSRIQNLLIRMRQKNKYKKVKVEDDYEDEVVDKDANGSPNNMKKRKGEEVQVGVEMI